MSSRSASLIGILVAYMFEGSLEEGCPRGRVPGPHPLGPAKLTWGQTQKLRARCFRYASDARIAGSTPFLTHCYNGRSGGIRTHDPLSPRLRCVSSFSFPSQRLNS